MYRGSSTEENIHFGDDFYMTVVTPGQLKRRVSNELDTVFDVDNIKKEITFWRYLVDVVFATKHSLPKATHFSNICGLCLAHPTDEHLLKQFRSAGYQRFKQFIKRLTRREVQLLDTKLVMWCSINLLVYYQDSFRSANGCHIYFLKRRLFRVKELLTSVVYMEMPERQLDVLRSSMSYFTRTQQWNFEEVVLYVFQEILATVTKQELVLSKIIKEIEVSQRKGLLDLAQMMTSSLAIILENLYWHNYQFTYKLHKCFNTMLKLYLLNDIDASRSGSVKSANIKFRIQIKNCMRHFISNIKDNRGLVGTMDSMAQIMTDPEIAEDEEADLIEMIAYCAQRLHTRLYRASMTPQILDFLLLYLKSDYRSSAMASQRIFQYLLDRHGNIRYFTEPIYYFKGRSNFAVNVEYSREDVQFFKSFSQDFFSGIYKCLNRYTETTNLVMSYTTLCLVLVEIPDPIYVVVKTQNDVLKRKQDYGLVTTAHIHSIVASILSLICLIHEKEVHALGKYVQEVVSYRNENSPHLLPPLSPHYTIAGHHTTDYHHQFYFLEEEVLYALKQCWLGRRRSN